MGVRLRTFASAVVAVVLLVAALWAWQQAGHLTMDAEQPTLARYAVQSAAVSAAGLGESFVLLGVVGNVYRARPIDVSLRFLAAGTFLVTGLVAAVLAVTAFAASAGR